MIGKKDRKKNADLQETQELNFRYAITHTVVTFSFKKKDSLQSGVFQCKHDLTIKPIMRNIIFQFTIRKIFLSKFDHNSSTSTKFATQYTIERKVQFH